MVRSSHGELVQLKRFPHRVLTRIPHHGLTGIPHRNPLFDRFRGCATVRLRKPLLRSDIRDIEGIVYGFKQPMGQMTTSSVFRRYAYSSVATTTITTILCKLRSAGYHIFVRLNVIISFSWMSRGGASMSIFQTSKAQRAKPPRRNAPNFARMAPTSQPQASWMIGI